MSIPDMPAEMLEIMSPERWLIVAFFSGWALVTLGRRYFRWRKSRVEYKRFLATVEKSIRDNAVFKADVERIAGQELLVMNMVDERLPGRLRMVAPMPENAKASVKLANKMAHKLINIAAARIAISAGKEVRLNS